MISKDSEIIDIPESNFKNKSDEIFELIFTTSHSLLYRMRKDGKYFIVKQSALANEIGRKILRREYEISLNLNHPNIVGIYEYRYANNFEDQIVMEFVDGRSLNDYLAENPPFNERKRIFNELLDAVDYLHKHRIIHNDLKPENIIISRTGNRVKLIDLGYSDDDANYALNSIGFTRGYSAPELINGTKSDVRSDIYSIGVITRLLFGKRYRNISKKCTKENPLKRFGSIEELKRSIDRLYWRWLIPFIGMMTLVVFFLILLFLEDRKSENIERESLKKEISIQNLQLKEQKESFTNLQKKYDALSDSIITSEQEKIKRENNKKAILDKYTGKLQKMTKSTIDSLRKNRNYMEMSTIRLHYMNKARIFYESQHKEVNGEDLSYQFYSILTNEMQKVDKAYDNTIKQLIDGVQ